jgi:sulfatase maturation enzyme AslB (radical SAM superfamily)
MELPGKLFFPRYSDSEISPHDGSQPLVIGVAPALRWWQMESIYYVMTWLCHRTCEHCYEDRFRPYYGEELRREVEESRANFSRIIQQLPERMTFRQNGDPQAPEQSGTVILAGGELLLNEVRESVLYPAVQQLHARYRDHGGVRVIVQTTGDLITEKIARELHQIGVWTVSVSGIDAWHKGLEEKSAQDKLVAKISGLLEKGGFEFLPLFAENSRQPSPDGRYFHFFGAQPDLWIGSLWPRGRAWTGNHSTATLADNFCNRWSGGLRFLEHEAHGSEVSIDPAGNVFPCCIKTKKPIGNLMEEPLLAMLQRLRGNPVYEAINAGEPQRMGLSQGWSEEHFLAESKTTKPDGTPYQNLCVGCDAFHDQLLGTGLVQLG